ncbi:MAG: phosphoenolpyruvate--protein phosphotransferase [Clostridia bacterium]|nr:phosphoenolpyruvate--protein phosphotransferase [Clostridia bacterium]
MILMQGKGVSKGAVRGRLAFFRRSDTAIRRRSDIGEQEERARFILAQRQSAEQLASLAEKCRADMGDEAAILFETHAMFVEDEDYVSAVQEKLDEGYTAEYAVQEAGDTFSAMFAAMDDAYMNARAADIRDVTRRMIANLAGMRDREQDWNEPVILAADDLAPSETIQLDKTKILGFVMREGSASGHTAILARTMGIPAVCGVGDVLREDFAGREAYMDGETGEVILDPDEITLRLWKEKLDAQKEVKALMQTMRGKEDITADGRRMDVWCNISSAEDTAAVLANDGRGIGLFRSEFLYLASKDFPDEEVQFEAYRDVVSAMNGRTVIIRTLDIGADKQADYFGLKKEENPALGLRAVRLCLSRPEVFRTQLRAIYRASAYGKAAIMFPMITSVWEVRECRRACQSVMQELTDEGVIFNPATEIGIMIETPASVLIADELAAEVDFFSVGTNDLTQYLLACDRQAGDLGKFLDPHHPAVLRALSMTASAAHRHKIRIGICGELASDPDMLPEFLAMWIDELSVSPPNVLPLRAAIRAAHTDSAKVSRSL